ncbi:MAG: prolyl oligopeptidase family serine peptidase [Parvularculaceae bacterium]|nr:prolyl oligopeptidase family serine peptidase [Parvularculaceae bacterium]
MLHKHILTVFAVTVITAGGAAARETLRERIAERRAEQTGGDRLEGPGDYEFTLTHDGLRRRYLVHVPASYDPAARNAVVVGLHGGGGHAAHFAKDENYGVISAAEKYGFIAVMPNGFSGNRRGLFATWNAGACCGEARDRNVDDVGFIAAVIEQVKQQAVVDEARVYAMGMSNGGLMAYRLACERPDLVRGIMAVAGTDNTLACYPSRPTPVLHIHARNDTHVLYDGGAGEDAFRDSSKVTEFVSVPATVDKWIALNNAESASRRVLTVDGAACDRHDAGKGGAPVQLCVTENGGHSWPGAQKGRKGKEPPSQAINANDVMWAFFSSL